MKKIKSFFSGILGIVIFIASILIFALILIFGAYIAQTINPVLVTITTIITIICIFILIPLSIFKKTRIVSFYGLFISSYIFGFSLWIFSFLTTYFYWGFFGVILGLFVMGIGVLPFAFIASILHSDWSSLGNIIFMFILTFGSRLLALYLAEKIDRDSYLKEKSKQDEIIIDEVGLQEITDSEPEYVWECDYCGKEFSSESESDQHELICEKNINNKEEVWTCDFCNKEFKTQKEADKHEKICELSLKNKKINTRIYCIKCGVENPVNANFCKKCGSKIII